MNHIFGRIKEDIRRFWPLGILFSLYYMAVRMIFHGFCPVVFVTGIPCPGCGLTRAALFLLTGQLERSFSMNPAGILWAALIGCAAVNRYILGQRIGRRLKAFTVIVACVTIGIYLYRMALYFPGMPPVSYTGNNVVSRLIPGYSEWIRHIR